MAAGATMHTFAIALADVDRGVYEDLSLRVARHPSETDAFMLTRVLAYCLEYDEGIEFSDGISATDQPAVRILDLTGTLMAWIEVGAPDADKLHSGSLQSERVAVYTHRDPAKVALQWEGKRIHRAADIPLYSFDPGFVADAAARIERRNSITVSITERRMYLELGGETFESEIHRRPVG